MNILKSELTKLTSLRSTWVFTVLLLGSLIGPVFLMGVIGTGDGPGPFDISTTVVTSFIFATIAVIFAGNSVAGDYHENMHAHAFLTQTKKSSWLAARLLWLTIWTQACYWISVGTNLILGKTMPGFYWQEDQMGNGWIIIWTGAASVATLSLFGCAIAAITRSRVTAIGLPLVWFAVVEQMIVSLAGEFKVVTAVAKIVPMQRFTDIRNVLSGAITEGGFGGSATQQPVPVSVLIIVTWLVVLLFFAFVVNRRRDL